MNVLSSPSDPSKANTPLSSNMRRALHEIGDLSPAVSSTENRGAVWAITPAGSALVTQLHQPPVAGRWSVAGAQARRGTSSRGSSGLVSRRLKRSRSASTFTESGSSNDIQGSSKMSRSWRPSTMGARSDTGEPGDRVVAMGLPPASEIVRVFQGLGWRYEG